MLVSLDDGTRIGMQVKSGNVPVDRNAYGTFDGMVYLFAASGKYVGQPNPHCVCLEPDMIRKFLFENKRLMPGRIQRWIDYTQAIMDC
jgi:hypothetical protein